jgi:chromatin remodeling complex protein RSC6
MATETLPELAIATKTESSSENLKAVLQTITDQSTNLKTLANTVRAILKDVERQSKELEKLRNKRSRTKTERAANSLPSGITKPVAISDELAKFLGVAPGTLVPRNEVTKGVSAFVRENELSDPANKQKFILDDRAQAKKLRALLGNPSEDVTYFNLQRYLKHHYIVSDAQVGVVEKVAPPVTPKATSVPPKAAPVQEPVVDESSSAPAKKKILVKKKKELVEEV